jgi:hypothetical protein
MKNEGFNRYDLHSNRPPVRLNRNNRRRTLV